MDCADAAVIDSIKALVAEQMQDDAHRVAEEIKRAVESRSYSGLAPSNQPFIPATCAE